jgi:TPR repeat protein
MTSGNRRWWEKPNFSWFTRRPTIGLVLIVAVPIALLAMLAFFRLLATDAPELEPTDLLLLTPESVEKVETAAKAGDIQAQSTLGIAYLRGSEYVPRKVRAAVYWFHRIADRDRAEHDQIVDQMRSLLEERRHASDPGKQRKLDLEYLGLVEKRLSFELAFVGLIQVYAGGQGSSYANPELARKYLHQGTDYGFASAQRMLGMAYLFGLLGVPKNRAEGMRLLHAAAAQGDHAAEYVLRHLYESRVVVPANADAARYWFGHAAPDAQSSILRSSYTGFELQRPGKA